MTRGEFYLVKGPGSRDPKRQRVFLIVSRQALLDSTFSTVICAPVYSRHDGLRSQVLIGVDQGLKKESSIHCDELVSIPKALLTYYIGRLNTEKMRELNRALRAALDLEVTWSL